MAAHGYTTFSKVLSGERLRRDARIQLPHQLGKVLGKGIDTMLQMIALLISLIVSVVFGAGCANRMSAHEFDQRFPPLPDRFTGPAEPEDGGDTEEARQAAARGYLRAVGVERLLETMIHEQAKALPESERADFFRTVNVAITPFEMEKFIVRFLSKYLTTSQIEAVSRFYASREGQAILRKGSRQVGPSVPSEDSTDTPADRRVAAQRYMALINFEQVYGDMVRGVARKLPSDKNREKLFAEMARGYTGMVQDEIDRMTRYFTRREIDALTRFYSTPAGRALGNVAGAFGEELGPLIEQALSRVPRRK